ncbi:hypothetical protein WA158_007432 [Blastocystis sp. Blastoise]
MADECTEQLLHRAIALICYNCGFKSIDQSALLVLSDVIRDYILNYGKRARDNATRSKSEPIDINDIVCAKYQMDNYDNMAIVNLSSYACDEKMAVPFNISLRHYPTEDINHSFGEIPNYSSGANTMPAYVPPFFPPFPLAHTYKDTQILQIDRESLKKTVTQRINAEKYYAGEDVSSLIDANTTQTDWGEIVTAKKRKTDSPEVPIKTNNPVTVVPENRAPPKVYLGILENAST